MPTLKSIQKRFYYHVPPERIATQPVKPRDAAKLLVYNKKSQGISWARFSDLPTYLPKGAVVVFNRTKVIPARLIAAKPSGGKVRLLYLSHNKKTFTVLADRKLTVGTKLNFGKNYTLAVVKHAGKQYTLQPNFPLSKLFSVLQKYGTTPLPPYIKNTPLSEHQARKEYQSVFAHTPASIAAPTASLHFTTGLIKKLRAAGHPIGFITLHVNLGTFAPLTQEQLDTGTLHQEYYSIPQQTVRLIAQAQKRNLPIVAVGTTVVRALESAANKKGELVSGSGSTQLFITENYTFRLVSSIITNFHVPGSSLLMLVSACIGRKKLLTLYQLALEKKYRFFSFGDGMLII